MPRMAPREQAYRVMFRLAADGYRTRCATEVLRKTITKELDIVTGWRITDWIKALEAWGYIEQTDVLGVWMIHPESAGVPVQEMDKEAKHVEKRNAKQRPPSSKGAT